jgi:hypothetical protein
MNPPRACPHCGYDGSGLPAYGPEPFTYFELVPRWQKVFLREGRLVVDKECSFGDEGEALLRCNECESTTDQLPDLDFETGVDAGSMNSRSDHHD